MFPAAVPVRTLFGSREAINSNGSPGALPVIHCCLFCRKLAGRYPFHFPPFPPQLIDSPRFPVTEAVLVRMSYVKKGAANRRRHDIAISAVLC